MPKLKAAVVSLCHNRYRTLQQMYMMYCCPQRTTLSTFTESVWTEIVNYIHSTILWNQIAMLGIQSPSPMGGWLNQHLKWYSYFSKENIFSWFSISIMRFLICQMKNFLTFHCPNEGNWQWPPHNPSNRTNRQIIVYFKGYACNKYVVKCDTPMKAGNPDPMEIFPQGKLFGTYFQ